MSAGVWQDQQVRLANEKAGWKLCGRCKGTGNELYSMYRACSGCGGSGQTGEPPLRVRFERWWRQKRRTYRDRNWRSWLHWLASYYVGIGHWFRDGRDNCRHCDARPSDVDFEMRRMGPFRAECVESKACAESVAEMQAEQVGGGQGEGR